MSTTDPRVLLPLLEDLQQGLRRGTLESRETLHEAESSQQHLQEHCARLLQRTGILEAMVANDEVLAGWIATVVEQAAGRAEDASQQANGAQRLAEAVRAEADQAHATWRSEVGRARHRESAARAWVSRAQQHVAAAQQQLSAAHAELSAAQSELAQAQQPIVTYDQNGNAQYSYQDCTMYVMCVQQAQYLILHAEQTLHGAQSDLGSAQCELAQAQQDLARCEANLARAEQALPVARDAVEDAQAASSAARQALDAVGAARVPADGAARLAATERLMVGELLTLALQAEDLADQATEQMRSAWLHGDAVEDAARLCDNDLSLRADHLRSVDRPHAFV
jgi:hypothetical protein